eukprot:gnl/TRDRNA2_/TRDRNA2_62950_c0_seq1.p1 gnl/TRDRNA2_/TRDRNA2_62950_c0~~gnl/TRDRNA2_/TRDRNA2_62950_c0_seq1.p1  ORF type:complete len:494 (-),score=89.46 gnl/TRDRNA2_/TRDRNA2_62950_c0_seq1:30-1511(-)
MMTCMTVIILSAYVSTFHAEELATDSTEEAHDKAMTRSADIHQGLVDRVGRVAWRATSADLDASTLAKTVQLQSPTSLRGMHGRMQLPMPRTSHMHGATSTRATSTKLREQGASSQEARQQTETSMAGTSSPLVSRRDKRRILQPAVLAELDAAYIPSLGRERWEEVKTALLAGRKGWQYAAVRNRFFDPEKHDAEGDAIAELLKRRRDIPGTASEADLKVLFGHQTAEATSIQNICADWPTPVECYISTHAEAGGYIFPRCGGGVVPISPYWMMSATSVLPVLALDPRPGDTILDLCASPGGKSFIMTQHADNISIQSNDLKRSSQLELALANHVPDADIVTTAEDGRLVSGTFDKVIVDAPCSTDKHLLLSTDAVVQHELPLVQSGHYPRLQLELLQSGLRALKPGGSLVYCTCTLDRRQNSLVVEAAMKEQDDSMYRVVPLFDRLHEHFGEHFKLLRQGGDTGVLVVPSLAKNWGPLYVALIEKSVEPAK